MSALIVIIVFSINRTFKMLSLKNIPFYLLYGIVAIGGAFVFYAIAMNLLSTAMAVILLYTGPTFINVINRIVYKKFITKIKAVSLILTFSCCFFLIRTYDFIDFKSSILVILFGLLSGLCYAMVTVFREKAKRYFDDKTNAGLILIFGSLVFLFLKPPWQIVMPSYEQWLYYIALAIIATVIPYVISFGY